MKPLFLFFICLLFIQVLQAQMRDGRYGNEWIEYGKTHYKINIHQDGVYRLEASVLQAAGFDLSRSAGGLRLHYLGETQPIYVHAPNGQIEYVEFLGRRNRGQLDVNLYPNPNHHFNPAYSLITDTSAYFLSWTEQPTGGRFLLARSADLSNLPAPSAYCWRQVEQVFSAVFNQGKSYSTRTENLSKSTMEFGEGFGSALQGTHNINLATPQVFAGGPEPRLRFSFYAPSFASHQLQALVGGQVVFTRAFSGDSVGLVETGFPLVRLQSGTTAVQIRGSGAGNNLYHLGFVSLRYPANFDFGGAAEQRFELEATGQRQFLELRNLALGSNPQQQQPFIVYDWTFGHRIEAFWDGSRLLVDLPPAPSGQLRALQVVNRNLALRTVGRLQALQFRDLRAEQGDYLIISHASLFNDGSGGNPVLEYAAYRASTGFQPLILEAEDLANQFAYGLVAHPLSIRNFVDFALANWTQIEPKYVFIIGKGRPYPSSRLARPADLLVPTFGFPPSDQLLLARLGSDAPRLPIGRLAAREAGQVRTYLTKIRDTETLARNAASTLGERAWLKRVLHLGGGADAYEQGVIRNTLNAMKAFLEGPNFGAGVESFFKNSTAPIQAAQSAYLDSLINGGLSVLTFFGHSSANSFDFNLDYPENYRNFQRYPLLMALGCYGGTIWEPQPLISERFVFEPRAGSVVFLAAVGAASLNGLADFGPMYYRHLGGGSYGKGAGDALRAAIAEAERSPRYNAFTQMAYQYMTYHGDPAFGYHAQTAPDYYLDNNLVRHSPSLVSTQMEDFELQIDMRNLGRAVDTAFWLEIKREYPDGSDALVFSQRVSAPYFADTVTLRLPVGGPEALGLNFFTISLDAREEIEETPLPQAEQNNQAWRYPLAISSETVLPVYPYEFAIVPERPVELRASTGNPLAAPQTYVLEIDTTAYFNSPLKQQTRLTQGGGLLTWTPNLAYRDSVVYYWRVSRDSISPQQSYLWANSSFIYLGGSFRGWNQSHFFQFKRDWLQNLVLAEPNRRFEFQASVQEVLLRNGYTPSPLNPERLTTFLNGGEVDRCRCPTRNGIFVQVIRPNDLSFWTLPPQGNRYGAINCDPNGGRSSTLHLFQVAQPAARTALTHFIRDSIPSGHYVLLFTLNNSSPQVLSPDFFNHLRNQGLDFIDDWANSQGQLPFSCFFKQGDAQFSGRRSVLGSDNQSIIELSGLIDGNWDNGFVRSTRIGPVSRWVSLHWRTSDIDAPQADQLSLDLYGLGPNGSRQILATAIQSRDTLIDWISASQYPQIELIWRSRDTLNRTSAQLNYWRVLAEELPEAALDPNLVWEFQADTLNQGQNLRIKTLMRNIGPLAMDSMLVKFALLNSQQNPQYQRLRPLALGDTIQFETQWPSSELNGPQQLLVEINPNQDQAERYHFNNFALVPFFVRGDNINPLLDVTFDGRRIINGDLVSSKPEILIQLKDDNRYLALNRLEDFNLVLRHPSLPNGEIPLNPQNTNLQFFPADTHNLAQKNEAKILLRPELLWDGTYTLIVSAKDRSGNNSGQHDYRVQFEVLNKPALSNVFNYPNPFTTRTHFVFTLTGSELPDEMLIQIYTIRGALVREIRLHELGPLHIGHNRSQYAWDGTDHYGQALANGVYLYRVQARKQGREYEHYQTRRDHLFRQGFGKMYLMR